MQPRFNRSLSSLVAVATLSLVVGDVAPVSGETIVLRSGQAAIGSADPAFTFMSGQPMLPLSIGSAFTSAQFSAALAGSPAIVVSHVFNTWIESLSCDPEASWISSNANRFAASTLFACTFEVEECCGSGATLTFCWAADDQLGDLGAGGPAPVGGNPAGVYINEVAVVPTISGGDFTTETTVGPIDISSLVHCGTNTFYVYNRDVGAIVTGAIFRATIEIVDCTVRTESTTWSRVKALYR